MAYSSATWKHVDKDPGKGHWLLGGILIYFDACILPDLSSKKLHRLCCAFVQRSIVL